MSYLLVLKKKMHSALTAQQTMALRLCNRKRSTVDRLSEHQYLLCWLFYIPS
jgi:hypothetical protein